MSPVMPGSSFFKHLEAHGLDQVIPLPQIPHLVMSSITPQCGYAEPVWYWPAFAAWEMRGPFHYHIVFVHMPLFPGL